MYRDDFYRRPELYDLEYSGLTEDLDHYRRLARGASSLRVKKVKGHATEDHISKGEATRGDKEGNDRADAAATKGVEEHGIGKLPFLEWIAHRQK